MAGEWNKTSSGGVPRTDSGEKIGGQLGSWTELSTTAEGAIDGGLPLNSYPN